VFAKICTGNRPAPAPREGLPLSSAAVGAVVAIDAGTTGIRTLAFDDAGRPLSSAYRALTQHFPRPGWVEHDPQEIWDLVRSCLADVAAHLAAAGTAVAALGVTNQRETAVAWDRGTGTALGPAIVWQDRRTTRRCGELAEAGHLPLVRERTGLVLDPYFTATKFEWMLRQGHATRSSSLALGTVDSWVLWNLTGGAAGGVFATDVTNAARTMLFDITARQWSGDLCDLFEVPLAALPEVHPSCGRLGFIPPAVAAALPGLAAVPVSGLAGDQHAALFGQACVRPGLAKATYGTGSFVLVHTGDTCPPPPEGLLVTPAWDLGRHGGVAYALEGSTFVAGAAIQWLRDGLGLIGAADEIGPLAASVPDAGGLVAVPAFTGLGSPWWDPRARGTVVGISQGTSRAELARSVVEAMAFGVRDMVDAMAEARGEPCTEVRADGGAAVMDLLLQLQADQLQAPVVRPRCTESTALGAAMLAGLAEGVWSSVAEVTSLWGAARTFEPSVDAVSADAAYDGWRRAVARSRDWARDDEPSPTG
jgi:glycerol kinase